MQTAMRQAAMMERGGLLLRLLGLAWLSICLAGSQAVLSFLGSAIHKRFEIRLFEWLCLGRNIMQPSQDSVYLKHRSYNGACMVACYLFTKGEGPRYFVAPYIAPYIARHDTGFHHSCLLEYQSV